MTPERRSRWDPRRLLAGARTRVLLAFVVLLALSTIASTLALRQILLARAGERVEQALVQEVREFEALADDGRNPLTGEPFGNDVRSLFEVFLQRNVVVAGEEIFTFVDGTPFKSTRRNPSRRLLGRVLELGGDHRAPSAARSTPPRGAIRYLAVPLEIGDRRARRVRRRRQPRAGARARSPRPSRRPPACRSPCC